MSDTQQPSYLASLDMYITKATSDGRTMRWAAVNSDTSPDLYAERMSYELYKSFENNIKNEVPVPEEFRNEVTSSYWDGGMPYLSISHYSDLNGEAVPGEPLELYVDGDQKEAKLKAKGILFDSPLGHSVFRSLKEDKVKNPDEKIRISIGFLDLAHRHGENGPLFVRDSRTSVCPECEAHVGQKIYVNGYLVHLALTRVPVNTRTEMVLEEKSMATKVKKTRKEDAASIVGKDLAEELDVKNTVSRSDVLVEMSDAEDKSDDLEDKLEEVVEPVVETPVVKESEAVTVNPVIYESVDARSFEQKVLAEIESLKSMISQPPATVELSVIEDHPLQPAIDALLENIDNSAQLNANINEKLEQINPALQQFGTAISDFVSKSVSNEPAPAPNENVAEILKNLIQPLTASVNAVAERIGILESKSNATSVNAHSRVPMPRTLVVPPNLVQKSEEPKVKPGSLRDVVNKSIGIIE